MARYEYAWAVGWNVPLNALTNVEDYLYPYTAPRLIAPISQPPDLFPVRIRLGSGRERGDGIPQHDWTFPALPTSGVEQIINDIFSGGTVVSRALTINTPRHDLNTYARCNVYAALPKSRDDMEHIRPGLMRLTIRFTYLDVLV